MALDHNATKLAQLINPEVIADLIDKKLVNAMKFAPLALIDTTLVGTPGNTVTLPSYKYIGDATVVGEGEDIPISQLSEVSEKVTIKKLGKGVQITDEAILSGFGDPVGEGARQIRLAIASQVDNEVLEKLKAISGGMLYTAPGENPTTDDIIMAMEKFGEDTDGVTALLCSPKAYVSFRQKKTDHDAWQPITEIPAEQRLAGAQGIVYGAQVIVSNKLTAEGEAYLVKPGALRIYTKRDTLVEADRDIVNKSNVITGDKHFAIHLYDASKAVKIAVTRA